MCKRAHYTFQMTRAINWLLYLSPPEAHLCRLFGICQFLSIFFQTQILNLLCVISALPPVKETKKPPEGLKPFKPSSPAKEVIKLNHLNEEFLRLIHVPDGSLLSFSRKGHYLTGLAFFQEGMLVHGCLNPVGLQVGNLKEFCDIQ